MANISDAFGAFALGTLSKAAGQDFLSPMLQQTRDKDMFLFQQKEAMRMRDEVKRKDREERRASRQNLVKALQATNAILPEDVLAAGGVDALAAMDDTEFTIATARMTDQQMRRLGDADLEATLRGSLPALGLPPLGPGPHSRDKLLELKAQVDMNLLLKEQGKQQRDDTTRALRTTVAQAQRDVAAMFERSQAITVDTQRNAFGRLQQTAARLTAEGSDLSDADYENLQGELNSLADMIRRQQVNVDLNNLARETPGRIIAGMAQLDPDQRSQALERPSINRAWSGVERAATQLASLGEQGARDLGLGDLYAQANGNDPAQDGLLAQALFSAADKIAAGQGTLNAMGEAKQVNSALDAALEGFSSPVDAAPFIKNGQFDASGFAAEKLRAFKERIPDMSRQELLKTQRRLQRTGLPANLIAGISADVDNRLNDLVEEKSPSSFLSEIADRQQVNYTDLNAAVAIPPIIASNKDKTKFPFLGDPTGVTSYYGLNRDATVNPEWAGAMAKAFKGFDESLNQQVFALERAATLNNIAASDFSEGSAERARIDEFGRSLAATQNQVAARKKAREAIKLQLSHLTLNDKAKAARDLFKLGGGKDIDVNARAVIEENLRNGGVDKFFQEFEAVLKEGVNNEAVHSAISAEITTWMTAAESISQMFQGEDADKIKAELKHAGIITTVEDDSYPELEVLAYFMSNQ